MNVKENIQKLGEFWFASNPDVKFIGMLNIIDGGEINIELIKVLDGADDFMVKIEDYVQRINGRVEKYGYITLEKCYLIYDTRSSIGVNKYKYVCSVIYMGISYDVDEEILFDTFIFSLDGIEKWVNINGFKESEFRGGHDVLIEYIKPEDLFFDIGEELKLKIQFLPFYGGISANERRIGQNINFSLDLGRKASFFEFLLIVNRISSFMEFIADRSLYLYGMAVLNRDIPRDEYSEEPMPLLIQVYYNNNMQFDNDILNKYYSGILDFNTINDKLGVLLNRWLELYNIIEPALNLYFSIRVGAYKYSEGNFLALAQALETYHRRTSDEKMMDEEEFNTLINNIIKDVPENYQSFIRSKFTHANEIPLRKRLERMIEPFKELIGSGKRQKALVHKIVETRNYLTHYDNSLETNALNGEELYRTTRKMEVIFQLHLLSALGFSNEDITAIFNGNSRMKNKLLRK